MDALIIGGCTYGKGELREDELALLVINAETWTIGEVEYKLHYNPREEWTLYIEDEEDIFLNTPQFFDLIDLVTYLKKLLEPYGTV